MPSLRHKRGTLAQINEAALAGQLKEGEVYMVTDESRLTVGTSASAHAPVAKQSEVGSGGSTLKGQATVTIPLGYDATQTVVAVGVVPSMMILVGLAPVDDAAENSPDFLNPSYIIGVAGEDEINFQIGFDAKESGPVLINWSAI